MQRLLDFRDLEKFYSGKNKLSSFVIAKSWFPLYAAPALAGIVADLMGDGHLQGPGKWRFDFCSNSVEELNRFEKVLFNLFSVKGSIRDCTSNAYGAMNYGVNCRPLAKVLFLIGTPFGNKVLKDYGIPQWVFNDSNCFASFVKRYFDCEGSVDMKRKELVISIAKSVDLKDSVLSFLNQIKQGLWQHFEIVAGKPFFLSAKVKRKYGATVQMAKLKINGQKNLRKFHDFIGFDTPQKMAKLATAIS